MNADKLVQNEIYYNVSMLINELAQNPKYMDNLLPILVQDDYRTALEESSDLEEILDWVDVDSMDNLFNDDIREITNRFNVEPYQNEALEHWIVSDWLADKLEERGEMVIRDFMGLTVWGRTTSGQHISMDYIIQKIVKDLS